MASQAFRAISARAKTAGLSSKKIKHPGRLNDLRHVIYKSFSEPTMSAVTNLGILAREGLLKENIDGEALLWAYQRLEQQQSPHKFLFMLSDGAPVDDSTLSVNPRNFLERHLVGTIGWLERQSIKLVGIGIAHDVSRYYSESACVTEPDELGLTLIREFLELVETLNLKPLAKV